MTRTELHQRNSRGAVTIIAEPHGTQRRGCRDQVRMKVFSLTFGISPAERATQEPLIHGAMVLKKPGAAKTLGLPHLCDPEAL